MKEIAFRLVGTVPLLMNSSDGVNPLHPLVIEKNEINAKKGNKTPEDLQRLSDIDMMLKWYWEDGYGLCVPATNILAMLRDSAKRERKGSDITKFVDMAEPFVTLDIGIKNVTQEEILKDFRYRDVRPVRIKSSRVPCTRPRFDRWALSFIVLYDEKMIDPKIVLSAMDYAGKYVGLCDYRPRYGRFEVVAEVR